jgi:hypothetical protein
VHRFHFTVLLVVAAAACDRAESTGPTTTAARVKPGALGVTVVTHGLALDPDGYVVTVVRDGNFAPTSIQRVVANGNTMFSGLAPGGYFVGLQDVAPPCSPTNAGPARSAGVIAKVNSDAIAEVEFDVGCPASGYGLLQVSVRTSLVGADGKSEPVPATLKWPVRVDEGPARFLTANESIWIDSITPGSHLVELNAGGCLVHPVGNNKVLFSRKMTVVVPINAIAAAAFQVWCVP